ncbi:methylmalonyl-CoA mutase family protein [Bacillus sp. CGMCC 1.16607]|uniref:methylmalonyl-CoA mutase family protein n=1 Tax=Bacillus sp. CGMCC 1.16607 TaxID=3351842 RepID=UPI00362956A5
MCSVQMRNETFSPSSFQDWKEKAEESLKGKKLDSLMKHTYEDIVLKPLYSADDLSEKISLPGDKDYRRGIHALGYLTNPWKIAQNISYENVDELKVNLAEALNKGQSALAFKVKKDLLDSLDFLSELISVAPLAIETKGLQKSFLEQLVAILGQNKCSGYVGEDPISLLVKQGSFPLTISSYLDTWAESISLTDQSLPKLKTILIDTTPYHNGGASSVQELSVALATAVYYIEELKKRGLSLEKLFVKLIFKFQIGSNFFMELAKLRAARVLWDKIGEAYGISSEHRGMEIIAETSSFTKTLYDPHVNILRSGNEAFAAILGGIQYLQVQAFNDLETITTLSERLARNTQLILKEESHLKNTVDPAGGSWYIESLTNELVEKSWNSFLEIDDQGGILAVLESNWLQTEIAKVLKKRLNDVHTRKQSVIGTNVYANLQEAGKKSYLIEPASIPDTGNFHSINPILPLRLSESFEKLRQRASLLKNQSPIGLICLGEVKQHKARADFITGFLAAGGLGCVRSHSISNSDEAEAFLLASSSKHFVICSSNEIYHEFGLEIVKKLTSSHSEVSLYLAGLPEKDVQSDWQSAGINQFIHVKTNCFEFLSSIITEIEEVEHSE